MKLSDLARHRSWAVGAILFAFAGCRPALKAPPPPPPPAVTVIRPISYPVQSYYEYNGYLDAVESVQIRARVKGVLEEVKFKESTEVEIGDELYRIDTREYDAAVKKADADRLKAVAELRRARAEEERSKPLLVLRNLSAEEFQQRVAARETAEAMIKQTEAVLEGAELDLSYTKIKAPIAGQISRTLVTRGNLVGQGEATLLTTIVAVQSVYIYFDVPERDLLEYLQILKTAKDVARVEIGVAGEDGYPHVGTIDFRENRAASSTGTIRIRGRIENPPDGPKKTRRLHPGMYARVRVPRGDPKPQLTIPEEALMAGQEGRFVYVLNDQNVVAKRSVTVGTQVWSMPASQMDNPPPWEVLNPKPPAEGEPGRAKLTVRSVVAIEKGLEPGDRVIVNGLQRARPGSPVAPAEWDFKAPTIKK
ncbi:MAG: efflux RND transporter periplasmic adaptor subunit [Planctomycetes bacterium]|nr:efflux RND transporter periplasmic adaptor subunit [Planctomycetota bacterium]